MGHYNVRPSRMWRNKRLLGRKGKAEVRRIATNRWIRRAKRDYPWLFKPRKFSWWKRLINWFKNLFKRSNR